jgi:tripeptide aminopeptidase
MKQATIKEAIASPLAPKVLDRLLRYARIDSMSDRHVEAIPSTPGQMEMMDLLAAELADLGIEDVYRDPHGYIIARVPPSPGCEGATPIAFMAHVDTSEDVTAKNVNPIVTKAYSGQPIPLAEGRALDPAEYPELLGHLGDTIVSSDGRTLLGADDKAGCAEIMAAAEWMLAHPELPRGPLELVFTPDEETGRGMDLFPLDRLRAKAAYTFDGEAAAEIEAECFTAYVAHLKFAGKSIHLGKGRGSLVNAVSMAAYYVSLLPRSEAPESTDDYYGYYCPLEIKGDLEAASLEVFLRDFADAGMKRRLEALEAFASATEAAFPGGSVALEAKEQYRNMKERLDESPEVLKRLFEAARRAGLEPELKPIRGGTDGARLTQMGVPCPNVFTGGANYHSRHEWASLAGMVKAAETAIELIKLWAEP